MALDLARTVGQIDSLARRLHDRRDDRPAASPGPWRP